MFNVRRNQIVDLHLQLVKFSSANPLPRLNTSFTFWIWLDSNAYKTSISKKLLDKQGYLEKWPCFRKRYLKIMS